MFLSSQVKFAHLTSATGFLEWVCVLEFEVTLLRIEHNDPSLGKIFAYQPTLDLVGLLLIKKRHNAPLFQYADPVADLLDKWNVFHSRLFRESCVFHRGNYVKDLGRLGRELHKIIIVDNSPASYIFHPDNAVSCQIPRVFLKP